MISPAHVQRIAAYNHHRGQATTLLTQSGANVGVTDLPALPGAKILSFCRIGRLNLPVSSPMALR